MAFFSWNERTSTTGGLVFGMSNTQDTPAWTAAIVPVPKSSLAVIPGSRKCTCGSMNAGTMIWLVPNSTLRSPPDT